MKMLNYLLKNITLLNILLLAGAIGLGINLATLRSHKIVIPAVAPPKPATAQEDAHGAGAEGVPGAKAPFLSDFTVVAENNLFHPERRIPPDKKEQALPKPELILFGTLVNGTENLAFIEDKRLPKTSPGRGKRQVTVKKGDMLGGFVVTSIETDRIKLVRGEEMLVFHLMAAEKRRGETASDPGGYTSPAAPNAAPADPSSAASPRPTMRTRPGPGPKVR